MTEPGGETGRNGRNLVAFCTFYGESSALHASWNPVDGAVSYRVTINDEDRGFRQLALWTTTIANGDRIVDLTDALLPFITVEALAGNGSVIQGVGFDIVELIPPHITIDLLSGPPATTVSLRVGGGIDFESPPGWSAWVMPLAPPGHLPGRPQPSGMVAHLEGATLPLTLSIDLPPGQYTAGLCGVSGQCYAVPARADFARLEPVTRLAAQLQGGEVHVSWQASQAASYLLWCTRRGDERGAPVPVSGSPARIPSPGTGYWTIEAQAVGSATTFPSPPAAQALDILGAPPTLRVALEAREGAPTLVVNCDFDRWIDYSVTLYKRGNFVARVNRQYPALFPISGPIQGPYQIEAQAISDRYPYPTGRLEACVTSLAAPTGLKGEWVDSEALRLDCSWDPVPGADCYWLGFVGGVGDPELRFQPDGHHVATGGALPASFWVQAIASNGVALSPVSECVINGRLATPAGLKASYEPSLSWQPKLGRDGQFAGIVRIEWERTAGAGRYFMEMTEESGRWPHGPPSRSNAGWVPQPSGEIEPASGIARAELDGPVLVTVQAFPPDGSALPSLKAECRLVLPPLSPLPPAKVRCQPSLATRGVGPEQMRALVLSWEQREGQTASVGIGLPGLPGTGFQAPSPITLPLPEDDADHPHDGPFWIGMSSVDGDRRGDSVQIAIEARLPKPTGLVGEWTISDGLRYESRWDPVPGAASYWVCRVGSHGRFLELCKEPRSGFTSGEELSNVPSWFWVQAIAADGWAVSPIAWCQDIRRK